MAEYMKETSEQSLIGELWTEHTNTPFPKGFRGMDVSGIDFVMLDADVAGCVDTFLSRGNLNLFQTAVLGLSYRNLSFVLPILNEEGAAYFWRLERLSELVLKAVALKNEKAHQRIS
jgi:hypothetical protein